VRCEEDKADPVHNSAAAQSVHQSDKATLNYANTPHGKAAPLAGPNSILHSSNWQQLRRSQQGSKGQHKACEAKDRGTEQSSNDKHDIAGEHSESPTGEGSENAADPHLSPLRDKGVGGSG